LVTVLGPDRTSGQPETAEVVELQAVGDYRGTEHTRNQAIKQELHITNNVNKIDEYIIS
jgi:hypothetical protein